MAVEQRSTQDKYNNFRTNQQLHQSHAYPREVDFDGRAFTCLSKDVFCWEFGCQEFMGNVPAINKPGSRILEISSGTGCLVTSLYLRNKERVDYVLGTDISPEAVDNTKYNFKRYGVPGEARVSDVFDNIKADEKFDFIFWNVPSFCIKEEDGDFGSLAFGDIGYKALNKFIRDACSFLKADGRVLFLYSPECGDLEKLQTIARGHRKELRVVWKSEAFQTTRNMSGVMTRVMWELSEA